MDDLTLFFHPACNASFHVIPHRLKPSTGDTPGASNVKRQTSFWCNDVWFIAGRCTADKYMMFCA